MSEAAVPPARRLRPGTMYAYGTGAIAYGVKDNGFGTFLLLFYNQVLGVPAATVGLVILAALVMDAIIDPAVGFFSDRTRSRWGRRHPWMYSAALPIAVGWLAVWNPPALSEPMTLLWLFVFAVLVRTAVSAYEVPSAALAAELTADYDERTRVQAYRYLFGWGGGLAIMLAAYTLFLVPSPGQPNGLLNPLGYRAYSICGAIVMAAAILTSALGTHREIPDLPRASVLKGRLKDNFRELGQTARNRAFLVLMAASICAYTNQGVSFALSNYNYGYVWRLKGADFIAVILALMLGAIIAFVIAPRIAKGADKRKPTALLTVLAAIVTTAPYALRLAGIFPQQGIGTLFPVYLGILSLSVALGVAAFIIGASMMADVVEDSEIKTGRRSEGVFFAGAFFIQKCTSGLGIFGAGAILALAGFPERAQPETVPIATIDRMTLIFIVFYMATALLSAWLFLRFPFGRAEHEARIVRLAAANKP